MGADKDVSVEEMGSGKMTREDVIVVVVCCAILIWLLPIVAAS